MADNQNTEQIFADIAYYANVAGSRLPGSDRNVTIEDVRAAYLSRPEQERLSTLVETLANQRTRAEEALLRKAQTLFGDAFRCSFHFRRATVMAAIRAGLLDVSATEWGKDYLLVFDVAIKAIDVPKVDPNLADQLLRRFLVGAFSPLPAESRDRNWAESRLYGRNSNQAYADAAKAFLEGDYFPPPPRGKEAFLNVSGVKGARPHPIFSRVKRIPSRGVAELEAVMEYVSDDTDTRTWLRGAHIEKQNNLLAATNGHALILLRDADLSAIPEAPADRTILAKDWASQSDSEARWLDGVFPDYQSRLEGPSSERAIWNCKRLGGDARARSQVYRFVSPTMPGFITIRVAQSAITINADYAAKAADTFRAFGYESFEIRIANEGTAFECVKMQSSDGRVTIHVMAYKIKISDLFAPVELGGAGAECQAA